jgi:phosphoglycolate phosphatase
MIGDTTFDVLMARAAGAKAVGVGWGYHPVAELAAAGADCIVATTAELPAAVRTLLP